MTKLDVTNNSPVEFKNQITQILRQCNHAINGITDTFEQRQSMNDIKLENSYIEASRYKHEVVELAKKNLEDKIIRLTSTLNQLKEIDV